MLLLLDRRFSHKENYALLECFTLSNKNSVETGRMCSISRRLTVNLKAHGSLNKHTSSRQGYINEDKVTNIVQNVVEKPAVWVKEI